MSVLLDVNVLIALIDPSHVAHDVCHAWFHETGRADWATCPITENGVIRIVGNRRYPNSPGSPSLVAELLSELCRLPGHRFWPDDLSLIRSDEIDTGRLEAPSQVTDTYLLALAAAHGGQLATLDRRLSVAAVSNGARALHVIGSP